MALIPGMNAGYPIPNILPQSGNAAFPMLPPTEGNQIPIAGPGAISNPTPVDPTDPVNLKLTSDMAALSAKAGIGVGGAIPKRIAQARTGTGSLGVPQSYLPQDQGSPAATQVAPPAAAPAASPTVSADAQDAMLRMLALRSAGGGLSDMVAQALQAQQQPAQNPLQRQQPSLPPGAPMPFSRPLR